jgi:hypothetical protein
MFSHKMLVLAFVPVSSFSAAQHCHKVDIGIGWAARMESTTFGSSPMRESSARAQKIRVELMLW